MPRENMELRVEVVGFVDEAFPGWVEATFRDAAAREHTLRDKVPIFTEAMLDESSHYPQPGLVGCEVVERFRDDEGRELARISTTGVESTAGLNSFVVFASQLQPNLRLVS
ncbi:MAG TPA: hypothetical protein VHN74_02620 [Candidatus Angelobacter sp.]|jgi:hypothetical protein|nr:hypothetical protein [Candidatus Angelobacter sp.]